MYPAGFGGVVRFRHWLGSMGIEAPREYSNIVAVVHSLLESSADVFSF